MTAPDARALLDELEKLRGEATPGPWRRWGLHITDDETRDAIGSTWKAEDAAAIVAAVNALPRLVAELRKRDAALRAVEALHRPYGIYDECDHEHTDEDVDAGRAVDCGDFLSCDDALMYRICEECCREGDFYGGQSEECVTEHKHGEDEPICPTVAALTAALTPERTTP